MMRDELSKYINGDAQTDIAIRESRKYDYDYVMTDSYVAGYYSGLMKNIFDVIDESPNTPEVNRIRENITNLFKSIDESLKVEGNKQ